MNLEEVKARDYESLAVLSNAVQAASNIVRKVAGNDVANGFNGEPITQDELSGVLTAKINGYLMNPKAGEQK